MSLVDLVLPGGCAGCGVPGPISCEPCGRRLAGPAVPVWPTPVPPGLPPPWAVARYDGVVRELILGYKERGMTGLRGLLGGELARAVVAAAGGRAVLLVPVPPTRRALRDRGDDLVLGLARRAATVARLRGYRVSVLPALRLRRAVRDSAGLSAADRAANLAGAFELRRAVGTDVIGVDIVVVDDVITTGATVAETAVALRRHGAVVVGAAAVAATSRWQHRKVA